MISHHLAHLLEQFGYGLVFLVIMLEAMGLPLPGESLLIGAALYAAATHRLDIAWLIPVAAAGAIMGDNFGYLIGRWAGTPLLARYGGRIGLTEDRLAVGQYLFRRYGGVIVFAGRFVAFLRTFAALLAGATHMHWAHFLVWNALGGIVWCTGYSLAAYTLGHAFTRITGPLGLALGAVAAVVVVVAIIHLKRNEARLVRQMRQRMVEDAAAGRTTA